MDGQLGSGRRWELLAELEACARRGESARSPSVWLETARVRALVGDHRGAFAAAAQALRWAPAPEIEAEAALIAAEAVAEEPARALRFAARAARVASSAIVRAHARRLEARLLRELGRLRQAAEVLGPALRERPDDVESWSALARLRQLAGQDALSAARSAEAAAARAPAWMRHEALEAAGRLWLELDRPREAMAAFRRAYALEPDDVGVIAGMGRAKRRAPEEVFPRLAEPGPPTPAPASLEAEAGLADRLRAAPEDLDALWQMSELRRRQGKHSESAAFALRMTRAARFAPEWSKAAAFRASARAWHALGQADRVLDCLRRAVEQDLTSPENQRLIVELKGGRGWWGYQEGLRARLIADAWDRADAPDHVRRIVHAAP